MIARESIVAPPRRVVWRFAASLLALCAPSFGWAGEPVLRGDPLARYLVSDHMGAALSPDGARACVIAVHEDGSTAVEVFEWASGSRATVLSAAPEDPNDFLACTWSSTSRVLVVAQHKGSAGRKGLVAVNNDGSAVKYLGFYELLSFAPEDPELVTVAFGRGWRWGRLDTLTGLFLAVPQKFDNPTYHYLVDGDGTLRAQARYTPSGDQWFIKVPGDIRWRFFPGPPDTSPWYDFSFAGFDALRRILYVAPSNGRLALFAKSAQSDETVFAHPTNDVFDLKAVGKDRRIVAAGYFDGLWNLEYLDARVNEVRALASHSFPGRRIDVLDEDWRQRFYLIRARGDRDWGDYYRFDTASEAFSPLPVDSPGVPERGATRRVSYEASDGVTIPANLFEAAEREPRTAVILPQLPPLSAHGYVPWDQEFVARYLAARGYLVLQPAVRGTLGYGEPAGDRLIDVRRAAADIADAADFLVHSGFADGGRICVVGFGFGATAALLAAIEHDVFRCVTAVGPPLDLRTIYKQPARKDRAKLFGETPDELDTLSPGVRAAEIHVPVQLVHGDVDSLLPGDKSVAQLHAKLVELGRPSELVEYSSASDDLDPRGYRMDFLIRVTEFLDAQSK